MRTRNYEILKRKEKEKLKRSATKRCVGQVADISKAFATSNRHANISTGRWRISRKHIMRAQPQTIFSYQKTIWPHDRPTQELLYLTRYVDLLSMGKTAVVKSSCLRPTYSVIVGHVCKVCNL